MAASIHVLIVEDYAADAELMLHELRRANFDVTWERVDTEKGFLAQLETQPDIILADYAMPAFDGMSALRITQERNPDIPFILVSGTIGEDLAVEAVKRGAADYLLKDRLARLAPAVTRALDDKNLRIAKRRAEEAARQSERRLAAVLDHTAEAMLAIGSEQQILVFNKAAETMFGYRVEEILGKPLDLLLPDAFVDIHRRHVRAFAGSGDTMRPMSTRREISAKRKDGAEFPVEIGLSKLIEDDRVILIALIVDITVRKRAEEALRESEEKYRLLVEQIHDVIYAVDEHGVITYMSPSVEVYTGYTPAELIGREFAPLIHPDDLPRVLENFMSSLSGQSRPMEYRVLDKVGAIHWARSHAYPIERAGRMAGVQGVLSDVTERKRAEEALAASEERLRLITDNMSDMVSLVDLQGNRQYISPAHTRIMGYAPEEMLGKSVLSFVHRDDQDKVTAAIQRVLTSRTADRETVEFRSRHADGHYIWLETIGKLLFDNNGNPIGAVLSGRDVTARKQAEEQTQQHLRRLDALRSIDTAISASLDLHVTLDVLLQQVVRQLRVDASDILLLNPHTQVLEYAAGRGLSTNTFKDARVKLGAPYAGRAALERTLIQVPVLSLSSREQVPVRQFVAEGFRAYYGAPLVAKGQVKGVLEVFQRAPFAADAEWLDFFETLAGQAAIAIDNTQLFDGLQRSNLELLLSYNTTIEGWSRALDLRDKETEGHTQRVTELTLRLAHQMGVDEAQLVHIRRGALLHDIGKMGVPDHILLKPGPLTDEEWVIMRRHPSLAYELLSPIAYLRAALDIPYCHHEKWDGTGYPRGLKGEQIPLSARIFAVVDVWDALRSDRPYRAAWSAEKVRAHIQAQSGKHFEPRIAEAFLRLGTSGEPG